MFTVIKLGGCNGSGKTSVLDHDGKGVYADLPGRFTVIRYHSLAIERESLPDCLEVTAWTDDGEIMGLRHRSYPVEGVQFHPESFLTGEGPHLWPHEREAVLRVAAELRPGGGALSRAQR